MPDHSKIPRATCLCSLLLAGSAFADDKVVKEYSFDLADISEVEFQGSVGSMDFVETSGTELKIVLVIEAEDEGWFGRRKDVDDAELESQVRNDRLVLEMEERDTNTEWTVQLPAVAVTRIRMGVGEIKGVFGHTELDVELGVGEIDIELPAASAGGIEVSVGVGDASLRGASSKDHDKAFISQDIRGHGEGNNKINVEVGVGEASVTLN